MAARARRAAAAALLLAAAPGAAGAVSGADPCRLLADNPAWGPALAAAQARWGVDQGALLAVLDQESSLRATARGAGAQGADPARNFGFAQADARTWAAFGRATGTPGARTDFAASAQFVGWYFAETRRRHGVALDDVARQYLAYKRGHYGFARTAPAPAQETLARRVAARAARFAARLGQCAPTAGAPAAIAPDSPLINPTP